jgi:hypothetical protein
LLKWLKAVVKYLVVALFNSFIPSFSFFLLVKEKKEKKRKENNNNNNNNNIYILL